MAVFERDKPQWDKVDVIFRTPPERKLRQVDFNAILADSVEYDAFQDGIQASFAQKFLKLGNEQNRVDVVNHDVEEFLKTAKISEKILKQVEPPTKTENLTVAPNTNLN